MFKRLKNIENAQKNLIRDDDNGSIYYTPKSEFDDNNDKYKKNQQNNNIDSKLLNFSNYLKSLSPEAQDLMDKIEDADDDIDDDKLLSIDSNKKNQNFNTIKFKAIKCYFSYL